MTSKHQIQSSSGENERADSGAGRSNPPSHETKFSGADGDRDIYFISSSFPVQLTTTRIGNLSFTRLIRILKLAESVH